MLYAQIAKEIKDRIDCGEFGDGDMLPKETELSMLYNVSRPTIRTAIMQLVNIGLLIRIKGKGTFVTKSKILESSNFFVESFGEEEKKARITEVLEFRTIPANSEIAEKLDLAVDSPVIKLVRLRYLKTEYETGPIVLSTSYFIEAVSFIQEYDSEKQSISQTFQKHGVQRVVVEKEIGAGNLTSKESRLLGVPENSLALIVSSIIWDQNNRKIEYAISHYPAERNKFKLRFLL